MIESIYSKLNDKDWLQRQLETKIPAEIARELNVHRGSVTRSMKRMGLITKVTRSKNKELDNRDWLENELKTKTIAQIAREIGATSGNVADRMKRYGIKLSTTKSESIKQSLKKKYPDGRNGKLAANWKDGKRVTGGGHVYIYSPEHPEATKQGTVMEHRLVMEEKLGRYLTKEEIVHHIDLDKLNNSPENLFLCRDNSHHRQIHAQLERKATELIRNGNIEFKNGIYV